MLSEVIAMLKIQKLKKAYYSGRETELLLSRKQIVYLIINLPEAHRNLSTDQFGQVYSLYKEFRRDKVKGKYSFQKYVQTGTEMLQKFEEIAPIELYNGERL